MIFKNTKNKITMYLGWEVPRAESITISKIPQTRQDHYGGRVIYTLMAFLTSQIAVYETGALQIKSNNIIFYSSRKSVRPSGSIPLLRIFVKTVKYYIWLTWFTTESKV